jgi:hypothetical protein
LACRLPGVGFHIAMVYRLHAKRFALPRGRHWGIGDLAKGLRVSHGTAQRGLRVAEQAGLLFVSRNPGCKPRVSILDSSELKTPSGDWPLHGPIPWSWWLPASRLPGKSLQIAAVCWLLAGWKGSAEFELMVDNWATFGLSRYSAYRGLKALEGAGLVSVIRHPGRFPIVSILEPISQ